MVVATKLTIDLKRPSSPTTIYVVQGDSHSRSVEVSLYSDGEVWQIPAGVAVSMRYSKPDYTAGYYDTMPDGTRAWTTQDNVITMQLAPQMLTAVGTVTAQLEFILGNAVLGTFSFYISVEGNPAADVVTSENYINWLQWIEEKLDKYIDAVKESGQFHGETLSGPVNMNGNRLYGLAEPVSDEDAVPLCLVKRAAPRNLLDNSDFTNPVNQRGQTSYAAAGYTIDRWKTVGNLLVTVDNGCITLANTGGSTSRLDQVVPLEAITSGKTYTVAVCTKDGRILCGSCVLSTTAATPVSTEDFYIQFVFDGTAAAIQLRQRAGCTTGYVFVALYEGEYTAETLPEYRPKGYGAELAECQRYFRRWENRRKAGIAVAYNATTATGFVFIPQMRITPSVKYENLTIGSDSYPITGIAVASMSNNLVELTLTSSATLTANNVSTIRPSQSGYLELSADL